MKKIKFLRGLSVLSAMSIVMVSTACSSEQTQGNSEKNLETDTYKIGIVKQLDHASLDEIANAITQEIEEIEKETGAEISYEVFSGQGDQTVLTQIGAQLIGEEYDAIIPIATLAAQVMAVSAEDTQTPVIYAGVSDPIVAELTDIPYVTGFSDALNTEFIMDMMFELDENIDKVGFLYSLSEVNSAKPIDEAKVYLDKNSIAYVEMTGNTNDEIIAAAGALIAEGVDAIFTPTDNIVMSAELAIYEDLKNAGIPHYTGADSFVRNGAFTTCGVNYSDLGRESARLAYEAITIGMDDMEDFYLMDGGIITVNTETAEALEIDYEAFRDLGEVVEVITTAE